MSENILKIVGNLKRPEDLTPLESYRKSLVLIKAMDRLNPYPRPRGFVFKAKTWDEYEKWKKKQANPRLW